MQPDILGFDIIFEAIGHFLRDEYHFMLTSAFRLSQQYFSFSNIIGDYFQDLSNSHGASSHEFEYQTVPGFVGPENDFIDGFFFEYVKVSFYFWPEQLAQHG